MKRAGFLGKKIQYNRGPINFLDAEMIIAIKHFLFEVLVNVVTHILLTLIQQCPWELSVYIPIC